MKAIALAEKHSYSDHLYLWSHFIAGISALKMGRLEETENICFRALAKNSKHLDSHYLLVSSGSIRIDGKRCCITAGPTTSSLKQS